MNGGVHLAGYTSPGPMPLAMSEALVWEIERRTTLRSTKSKDRRAARKLRKTGSIRRTGQSRV